MLESKSGIKEQIVAVMAEQMCVMPGEIETSKTFAELGLDSLDAVEIHMFAADAVGAKSLPDELIPQMDSTVDDFIAKVKAHVEQ